MPKLSQIPNVSVYLDFDGTRKVSDMLAGGYQSVANAAARTALGAQFRAAGMLVNERDTGTVYQLTDAANGTWARWNLYPQFQPTGYQRAGWPVSFVDSARRLLFGVRRDGTGYLAGKQIATKADLPTATTPLATFSRAGWPVAITDSARRLLFGVRRDGQAYAGGKRLARAEELPTNVTNLAGYARSGWPVALTDSARRLLLGVRRDGTVWAGKKRLAFLDEIGSGATTPPETYIPPLLAPITLTAAALGDSLTAGTGGTAWATQLAALIGGGFTASIYGYGGRKSHHIGGRVGTTLTFVTASGGAITGNGGVTTIMAVSNDLLWLPSNGVQTEKGVIVGFGASIHGTLTGTTTSGVTAYSFTSDAGTVTIKCGPETLFIPDNRAAITGKELWCAPGRNNYDDPATVKANQDDMIAFYRPTVKRILLFAVINGNYSAEYAGGANWEIVRDLNYDRRQKYPNHFVVDSQGRDLRERLVASYDPTLSLDVHAHENDYPPHSLRSTSANVTTLSADVNDSATVLTVTDGARIHDNALLIIGTEKMALVGRSGNQLTVTRGYAGTTPAAHVAGDAIATDDKVHLNTAGYGVWAQIGLEFRQATVV